MESLGIALGLLGGLAAAPVFCLALVHFVRRMPRLAALGFWVSVAVLVVATVDVVLVLALGAVRLRAAVGPAFPFIHFVFTFGAPAALACVLLLGRRARIRWWPAVAVLCWFVGAGTIFLQYDVSETLYGIDGSGGPYGAP